MSRTLILLLLLAVPLAAQDAPLFIERIEVRNHKYVSPHVVISESRLYEGRAYSEAELRDAATRLSRLPFLLSVDFSLEKGSERGKHVLVLVIHETRPFFFLIDAVPYFDENPYVDIEYDDRPGLNEEDLVLGYRHFVGRRGAVHIAFTGAGTDRPFTSEYASFIAGYTQYDLFGTRAFATLSLKRPVEGHGEGRITPQFVLGIPVSVNQTVTLELDETRLRGEVGVFELESEDRTDQRLISARWTYNTTNEPFFPTRGTLLSVAPHYGWSDGVNVTYPMDGQTPRAIAHHSRGYGMRVNATRFAELSERSSVWGDLRADAAQSDYRDELDREWSASASSVGVGAGYAFSLWSADERTRGDSRFELIARYAYRGDLEYVSPYFPRDPNVFQTSAAWVRRSSWGTLRLGVGYAW